MLFEDNVSFEDIKISNIGLIRAAMASAYQLISHKARMASAFNDLAFSDAIVVCRSQTWRVHKIIMCKGSRFFQKAFTAGLEESTTSRIEIEDEDPAIIHATLEFIYRGNYDHSSPLIGSGTADNIERRNYIATFHATMYRIADKLEVFGLQQYALHELEHTVLPGEDDSYKKIGNWCDLARVAHNELPESDIALKSLLVRKLRPHLNHFLEDKSFVQQLWQLKDFALALMKESRYDVCFGERSFSSGESGGWGTVYNLPCAFIDGMTFLDLGKFRCPGCGSQMREV